MRFTQCFFLLMFVLYSSNLYGRSLPTEKRYVHPSCWKPMEWNRAFLGLCVDGPMCFRKTKEDAIRYLIKHFYQGDALTKVCFAKKAQKHLSLVTARLHHEFLVIAARHLIEHQPQRTNYWAAYAQKHINIIVKYYLLKKERQSFFKRMSELMEFLRKVLPKKKPSKK